MSAIIICTHVDTYPVCYSVNEVEVEVLVGTFLIEKPSAGNKQLVIWLFPAPALAPALALAPAPAPALALTL